MAWALAYTIYLAGGSVLNGQIVSLGAEELNIPLIFSSSSGFIFGFNFVVPLVFSIRQMTRARWRPSARTA